uniref:Peptidase_M1 domain-containing protein n=1 Tax=Mesocestoides corti TaxID=53468 RepID=A0A5K3G1Y3_MESCO
MCSSPALAQAMAPTYGLRFDKQALIPGEKVNVTLTLPAEFGSGEDTEGISNTCLLRMVDVAMKNFENANSRTINFEALMKVLKNDRGYSGDYGMQSSDDAYRAAGLDFTQIASPKTTKAQYPCLMH